MKKCPGHVILVNEEIPLLVMLLNEEMSWSCDAC